MKEQSEWEWSEVTLLPNIPVKVMDEYIEVSNNLFPCISRHLILLQAHPKLKQYFIKAFPMYKDIVSLLGDTRTSGFASNDGRKKSAMSQATPGPSQAPLLKQPSTMASFVINPVLEVISLEMLSTQGVDSEGAVCKLLYLLSTAI